MAGETLLKVQGVETYYGNIRALAGVDISVDKGEIVSLIGANGAGKSTLMMTICGSPQARVGSVIFDGEDFLALTPRQTPPRADLSAALASCHSPTSFGQCASTSAPSCCMTGCRRRWPSSATTRSSCRRAATSSTGG